MRAYIITSLLSLAAESIFLSLVLLFPTQQVISHIAHIGETAKAHDVALKRPLLASLFADTISGMAEY
jgi:hypothetical protein